ncbi:MAG: ATP-binding protein [Deltaproteobacteria bacterium]|nr:ATP-binding protein [Deltaproteobacteria bacterium]
MTDASFHRYVIESMRSGVITMDREGEITSINENALRILEIAGAPADIVGKPAPEVLREHAYVWQLLLEAFKSRRLPNRAEMVIRGSGREGKNIGFSLSLVTDDAGDVIGSAIFFKDLTQIEQHEEGQRLRKRLAALGQMAAGLAHEIRNPLAGIEVTAGLLRRRLLAVPEDVGQIDAILSEVWKLNEIVTNCLDFVRPLSLNLAPTRIESVLDETLGTLEPAWSEAGIRVERAYEENLPPVMVDPQKVRQALLNLLLNAGDAVQASLGEGAEEGVVRVRVRVVSIDPDARTVQLTAGRVRLADIPREHEESVQLEIEDNGCGMDAATLDKIFYPFFTTKETGSGIGLAVAQKVVDEHRGLLEVESEPGRGATFTLKIPLRPPEPQWARTAQREALFAGNPGEAPIPANTVTQESFE